MDRRVDLISCLQLQNGRVPSAAPSFRGLGIGHDQVLTVLLENGAIREFAEAKRGEAEEVHALHRGSE